MRTLLSDIRFSLRTLRKSPGFTLIAILSIALGVGANAGMFSFVDAVLLRPLPVHDSNRIIAVNSTSPGTRLGDLSYADYADLRDRTRTLESLVCYDVLLKIGVGTRRDEVPKVSLGIMASGNFFSGLGIPIPLGRGFLPEEDQTPGRNSVAVISYALWERQFNSDPAAIGRTLRLNGSDFTVIGVAPRDFTGPIPPLVPDVYVPMNSFPQVLPNPPADFLSTRRSRAVSVLGRLKPGIKVEAAQAELSTLSSALAAQYPETNRDRGVTVLNYQDERFENDTVDGILALTLAGITSLVLLIACANVANLTLARGSARVKEIAIRMAIGAGRGRLVRQLLTESLVLAVMGGAAGLAVGYGGVRFLQTIRLPSDFPIDLGVRMDTRVLLFSFALSLITGIVFGLIPAFRSTGGDLASTIKTSDQGPSRISFWRGRMSARNLLVVVQLMLSVILLIAAGFFVRGFSAAEKIDPGFRLDHTLTVGLDPTLVRYNQEQTRLFYHKLVDRVRELGGVTDAALGHTVPFSTGGEFKRVVVEGYQVRAHEDAPSAWMNVVDERYFGLMETSIVSGRALDARDTANSPRVAIVNQTMAKRFWPNRDAIGARFRLGSPDSPVVEVVGIAKDGKYNYWSEPAQSAVWTPFAQDFRGFMTLHVRTIGDPSALTAAVRNQIRAIDADMPIFEVRSLAMFYQERAMLGPRVVAQVVIAIGLMGLLLAVIGLYGVVAYGVSRRTREFGIRMAIGARPGDLMRMVLGQGLAFTAIGLVLGLFGALFLHRFLADFLIGVSKYDPAIFLAVPLILAAAMMAACWLPARRAQRVDPVLTLRQE